MRQGSDSPCLRALTVFPSGDEYFLNSNNKVRFPSVPSSRPDCSSHSPSQISFFLEPSAVDPKDPRKLVVPKIESVNKIGHALCQLDPVFKKHTLQNEKLKDVARDLAVHEDPLGASYSVPASSGRADRLQPAVLQSMVICKQPKIGGKVPIHNDSTFLYTDPPSAVGFWIALEDCTSENGALVSLLACGEASWRSTCAGDSPFYLALTSVTPSPLALSACLRAGPGSCRGDRRRKRTRTGPRSPDGQRRRARLARWS